MVVKANSLSGKMKTISGLLALLLDLLLVLVRPDPVRAVDGSWMQTSRADFEAGTLANVDPTTSPGDLQLATEGYYIYTFPGNEQSGFWRYDVVADGWAAMAEAPAAVNDGGALAYDGGNYIYALKGGAQSGF